MGLECLGYKLQLSHNFQLLDNAKDVAVQASKLGGGVRSVIEIAAKTVTNFQCPDFAAVQPGVC